MTARRFVPVSLPELPEARSVYDWQGVLINLRMIVQRGTIAPNGEDAIRGAIRFMEERL